MRVSIDGFGRNIHSKAYVLGSALLSAIGFVITEIGLSGYKLSPPTIAIFSNVIGGLFLLVYYRKDSQLTILRSRAILAPLIIAAISTYGLAPLYSFVAVQQIGAGQAALLSLLETPFIILLGLIFLRERLSRWGWGAAGLALLGTFVITFDPAALRLSWTQGEFYALLSSFLYALGIVASRQVFRQLNAGWTSGFLLILGTIVLALFLPVAASGSVVELSLTMLTILGVIGLTRGLIWLLFNSGMKEIGASSAAILFLSSSFFTVIIQAGIAALLPNLALQPTTNLLMSLIGGILIAFGVVLWEAQGA